MNKKVEENKTLLVDGPASVTLRSGKVQVFGLQLGITQRIVIRESKRLPFEVQKEAVFEIALGAGADLREVQGSTIPQSWKAAYVAIKEIDKKPAVVVMVIGNVDSGKSSLCTYLANRLVSEKCRVAVLDEDLGQSDIGSPATVAYAILTKPVTDLFSLEPEGGVFVGATSPAAVAEKTVEAVVSLKKEILGGEKTVDYLVVNTDGWFAGNEAFSFKQRLAAAIEPDMVFCLEESCSATSLCAALGDALAGFRQIRADSPKEVRERDKEHRKTLRELGFAKYLASARIKVFPLNHVVVEGRENRALIWQHQAENLLVAFYDNQKDFLGIGVLRDVDYNRKALKILTAIAEKPASVRFGKVRLDRDLREISN